MSNDGELLNKAVAGNIDAAANQAISCWVSAISLKNAEDATVCVCVPFLFPRILLPAFKFAPPFGPHLQIFFQKMTCSK